MDTIAWLMINVQTYASFFGIFKNSKKMIRLTRLKPRTEFFGALKRHKNTKWGITV